MFVDCETHGESARVVVGYFVLFYGTSVGSPSVLAYGGGGGESIFYEGGAGYEGDVVEVYYLDRYAVSL